MPSAWRIVKASHADRAFTGEGAQRAGGRWNSPGVPVVYASEHKSLAVLEMLVHLDPQDAARYLTFRIQFDEALVERWPADRLPSGWREEMPARAARLLGDAWVRESRSALLAVPSAIIPEEDRSESASGPVYSGSKRKNLLSTPRFYFFDLGVRHAAAGLKASREIVRVNPGAFFEQWVGLELWKRLQYLGEGRLHYLRTRDGMEIDFIIEHRSTLTPIEVKWTERPTVQDARHLLTFLAEHPKKAKHGYVICRCSHPLRIHDHITALPWFCL